MRVVLGAVLVLSGSQLIAGGAGMLGGILLAIGVACFTELEER